MLQVPVDVEKNLEYILKEEISVYKSLLILETNKKDVIIHAKGKELESITKQIAPLLSRATEIEEKRQKAIRDYFQTKGFELPKRQIYLSEFLEKLDLVTRPIFEKLGEELRSTVSELREKVIINENLLKTKQEIFQLTLESLKEAAEEVSPEVGYEQPKGRSRKSIMLNASV